MCTRRERAVKRARRNSDGLISQGRQRGKRNRERTQPHVAEKTPEHGLWSLRLREHACEHAAFAGAGARALLVASTREECRAGFGTGQHGGS